MSGRRNVEPPAWAVDLVVRASQEFDKPCPPIRWNLAADGRRSSNGFCRYGEWISVTAGTSKLDACLVLMHELAHWQNGRYGGAHHGVAFWRKAWTLFRWVGLPDEYAMARSQFYMRTAATVGTREFGVPALVPPEAGRATHRWMERESELGSLIDATDEVR